MFVLRYNDYFRNYTGNISSMKIEYYKPKFIMSNGQVKIIESPLSNSDIKYEILHYLNNKIHIYICVKHNDDYGEPRKIEYFYNEDGLIIKEKRSILKNGNYTYIGDFLYDYNYTNRKSIYWCSIYGTLKNKFRGPYESFHYDENWNVIEAFEEDHINFMSYKKKEFQYENNLISKIIEFDRSAFDYNDHVFCQSYFKYLANGNIQNLTYEHGNWRTDFMFEYEYDFNNNWNKAMVFEKDENKESVPVLIIKRELNYLL